MKGGPFGLSLPWPDLALGSFRNVSKKWTDQCEDCSLKIKKGHCYTRAFFLKRKTRLLKMGHGKNRTFFASQKVPTKNQLWQKCSKITPLIFFQISFQSPNIRVHKSHMSYFSKLGITSKTSTEVVHKIKSFSFTNLCFTVYQRYQIDYKNPS